MGKFSGKCDLFNHINGMGGWYDRNGNPVVFGQEGVNAYYSDEMKDFEAFKKKTGGVIYQHKKITVTAYNLDFIKEHNPYFDYYEEKNLIPDKRTNSGVKEVKTCKFIYWNKEYPSLKALNKKNVYIQTKIYFNTILDLIKYYPYIVTSACGDSVFISDKSWVDQEYKEHLQYGYEGLKTYYDTLLAEHYFKVCKNYLLYQLDKRTCVETITTPQPKTNSKYYVYLNNDVDYNHPIEYVWEDGKQHHHFASPKLIKDNIIELHSSDVEGFLKEGIKNQKVMIKYVKMPYGGFPIILD